ncbi:Rieske (2Fe-2S) protein [Burkholderia guangdongensis]|uniref:Rieske (2Fe-2S) protein n=1 Tax=Burkholderia guangdongensis TaxID=1792500 RepID=UPI0015C9747C|nr:Rieske (2Fe-2S) protein [Burkholderia guangdongensis]
MTRAVDVCATDDLPPGQRRLAFANGDSIVVFNIDGTLHAIENSCPHQGASLAGGALDGTLLRCPAHGLRFDVATGRMPGVPGVPGMCVNALTVRIDNGRIVVDLPDA